MAENRKRSASPAREGAASPAKDASAPQNTVVVFGRRIPQAHLFRLLGLLAFFIIIAAIVVALWPFIGELFTEGGVERVVKHVQEAGPMGVLMLLGMQFLQVVVAFIPGEVVQLAAGMMFGPWLGALIIIVGVVISSWFIYQLVHRLGQPFVEDVVPTTYLEKFRTFESEGKLDVLVFILFLIPGMPKDVFTYLVPLTSMPLGRYLLLTTVARTPGIVMSTIAASQFTEGNYVLAIVILAVLAVIAVLCIVFRDRLFAAMGSRGKGGR